MLLFPISHSEDKTRDRSRLSTSKNSQEISSTSSWHQKLWNGRHEFAKRYTMSMWSHKYFVCTIKALFFFYLALERIRQDFLVNTQDAINSIQIRPASKEKPNKSLAWVQTFGIFAWSYVYCRTKKMNIYPLYQYVCVDCSNLWFLHIISGPCGVNICKFLT